MTTWQACAPFVLLALLMAADELLFHRKRGLGRFEALGHPVDTLSVALPLAIAALAPFGPGALAAFAALAVVSCVVITKDEGVHLAECTAAEQRVHALLFMLHPLVFLAAARLWFLSSQGAPLPAWILRAQLAAVIVVGIYQLVAWRKAWLPNPTT